MDSEHLSKFTDDSMMKEFSGVSDSHKYPSEQRNNGGLSIPPNVQLTVRTGIQKGLKPSICLCQQSLEGTNTNQRKFPALNSGIQLKKISHDQGKGSKNGIDHQKYFDFYFEILAKESSRSSQNEFAQCLPSYGPKYDQINNRQKDDKQDYVEIFNDKDEVDVQNDGQTNQEEVINEQNFEKQQNIDKQESVQLKQMDQQTITNVKEQVKTTEILETDEEFPLVLNLKQLSEENGNFVCKECGKAFQEDATFREHQEKKLCKKAVCIFCGQKFVTSDELENHKAISHHKCLQCNKLYNCAGEEISKVKNEYILYERIHFFVVWFSLMYFFLEKLMSHNKRHHDAPKQQNVDKLKRFQLKQMDQKAIASVEEQVKTTEIQKPKEITRRSSTCGICLEEFPTVLSLEQHCRKNGHFLCGECGEAFQEDAVFREHQDKKLCKKIVCTFCEQKFVTRDELENHKAIFHHKCLQCNKLYNTAGEQSYRLKK